MPAYYACLLSYIGPKIDENGQFSKIMKDFRPKWPKMAFFKRLLRVLGSTVDYRAWLKKTQILNRHRNSSCKCKMTSCTPFDQKLSEVFLYQQLVLFKATETNLRLINVFFKVTKLSEFARWQKLSLDEALVYEQCGMFMLKTV